MRDLALRYIALLIVKARWSAACGRWDAVDDLCDRIERTLENLPPVSQPRVWEGDYA